MIIFIYRKKVDMRLIKCNKDNKYKIKYKISIEVESNNSSLVEENQCFQSASQYNLRGGSVSHGL